MNIIQTFWSPASLSKTVDVMDKYNGGWPCEKYHAISWAYSFNSLKRCYPDKKIALYTDVKGADWLIGKLGLEYDDVSVSLDILTVILQALGNIQDLCL